MKVVIGKNKKTLKLPMSTFLLLCAFFNCIFSVRLQYISFWEYNPEDFKGWTNFAVSSNLTAINIGYSYGINHLFSVESIFFEYNSTMCANKNIKPMILRSDYLQRWNSNLPIINELYFVNKSIFGFFMGDELIWNGLNPSSLITAIDTIRNSNFSKAIIYENEAAGVPKNGNDVCGIHHNFTQIPKGLDWFSIDLYHFGGNDAKFVNQTVKPWYEQYVFPKMDFSYQSALCVPGSFASVNNTQCDQQCYDEFCAIDAQQFYIWGLNDERIIGLYPWHWSYCPGCIKYRDEIGTENMNITKQKWIQIGKQIIQTST